MGKKKVRISQCMIVKNEEKNIEKALSWGRDIMWEQIVVDTGSTDRTVEIAESMGAKVYYFEWKDDFAAAKNYALKWAKGDWIAFLDADEYMDKENVKRVMPLLEELRGSSYLALITALANLDDGGVVFHCGSQTRFFRNGRDLYYQGRIHEELYRGGKPLAGIDQLDTCEELTILHTGYAHSVAGQGQKADRNLALILKELEENPNNYNMMGYLGDVYRCKEEKDLAIEWYDKAVKKLPSPEHGWFRYDMRTAMTFSSLLSLLCEERKDEPDRILEIYKKALSYVPLESDLDYILGRYYAGQEEYENARRHLEKALSTLEKNGNTFYGANLSANLMGTWELLAICYFNMGALQECVNRCVVLLKESRYNLSTLTVLLRAFRSDAMRYKRELADAVSASIVSVAATVNPAPAASAQQVIAFLGKIYDLAALKDRLLILRAAKDAAYTELIQELRGFFTPEELEYMDRTGRFH